MDSYNAREVLRRRELPLAKLVEEFARNREATIAAVAKLIPSQLETQAKSLGGVGRWRMSSEASPSNTFGSTSAKSKPG
jgi:hypothetical protein